MFPSVNVYANWDGQIGTYVYCMSTAWSILILYHYTALMSENDRLFKAFSGMNLRNISILVILLQAFRITCEKYGALLVAKSILIAWLLIRYII